MGKRLVEPYKDNLFVIQNPASKPLTQEEMDDVYALPYMRSYHRPMRRQAEFPLFQR